MSRKGQDNTGPNVYRSYSICNNVHCVKGKRQRRDAVSLLTEENYGH